MQVPDTMKAAVLDAFGGPEELGLETVDIPELDPGEVLIDVDTAGVGVWDPHEREGAMTEWMDGEATFPYILGSDGAGTVVAVGDDVDRFEPGDTVFAAGFLNPKGGFYAEYAAVDAGTVARLPDGLDTEEAGALAIDGLTALQGLQALDLHALDSLLIFGASGGVGHLAVQLAHRMGARVFAVASGDDGVVLTRELGAGGAVDGKNDDVADAARRFAPDGFDSALILADGEGREAAIAAVRDGGRVAWPNGVDAPEMPEGVEGQSYDGTPGRGALDELVGLVEEGPFEVHVARTFPLEDAEQAHRALDDHYLGKLALDLDA